MKKFAMLFLAVLMSACILNTSPGDGEKVGQIVKLSKVGMINKTWEGQIVRGGFTDGGGVNGTAFDFTVEDNALAAEVLKFMESRTEVRIKYTTEGIASGLRTESSAHFLTSIKALSDTAGKR